MYIANYIYLFPGSSGLVWLLIFGDTIESSCISFYVPHRFRLFAYSEIYLKNDRPNN